MNKVHFKIIESRNGILPILATLLLIVIAVVAIAVTFDLIMIRTGIPAAEAGKQVYTASVGFVGMQYIRIDIGILNIFF